MRGFGSSIFLLGALALAAVAQDPEVPGYRPRVVRYELLDGSWFVDECLICGRPTILQPMRGTFDLVLVQDTPPFTGYEVRNTGFTAKPGFAGEVRVTGEGTYRRVEEFAVTQTMDLETSVEDAVGRLDATFASGTVVVQRPFPVIEIDLTQTDGTELRTFGMHLLAAPLREFWFSTVDAIKPADASPGDLLSVRGRVVRRNIDLVGRLGVMPIVPDQGLDAVHVGRRGEVFFSIPEPVWSETLGQIGHGDVLSDAGRIVKRNRDLLAGFGVPSSAPDAGLDALHVLPDGEILFSIAADVVAGDGRVLSRGDLLSDRGRVFATQEQLLARFHPGASGVEPGLDALCVLPGGEIWFSTEEGFTDEVLGELGAGDLLSDSGHRVFTNAELVAGFAAADSPGDHGLDACYLVTDTKPPPPTPCRLRVRLDRAAGLLRFDCDGTGEVFQLERAPGPAGPWAPCSEITPGRSFDDPCDPAAAPNRCFRVRQW